MDVRCQIGWYALDVGLLITHLFCFRKARQSSRKRSTVFNRCTIACSDISTFFIFRLLDVSQVLWPASKCFHFDQPVS